MEFSTNFTHLRREHALSQADVADRLYVTRQAVSRWERGETLPSPEMLPKIAELLGVTLDALFGRPAQLFCQSCGMPLDHDEVCGADADGALNGRFCKWCYDGGKYVHDCTMEEMIEECLPNMMKHGWTDENKSRAFLRTQLVTLDRWRADQKTD